MDVNYISLMSENGETVILSNGEPLASLIENPEESFSSQHCHQSVLAEPLNEPGFEDMFQSMNDCNEIYTNLPPMNERKLALERQLQNRRDHETLQSHGILPPSNTPSHYYHESKNLERARTESFLKKKILQRPDKKTLIQYHILEEPNVSPLIIEPQKKLQKAQLAHRLSEKISIRPGPLELIEKGILETPENLQVQNAIRNGEVHYEPVDSVFPGSNNQANYIFSSSESSPMAQSPPSMQQEQKPVSVKELKADIELKLRPQTPIRPTRCDSRRSNSNLRIKKSKTRNSRFKFHDYEPPAELKNAKRKENSNNGNNKNIMENHSNRIKQQQTLLLEIENMTSTLERSQSRRNIPVGPSASIPDDNSQFKVKEPQMVTTNFQPEIMKTEPVNIAPSPVPTGDLMVPYLKQRRPPFSHVEKIVHKFESCQGPMAPPPANFKAPPTPPPVERLENSSVVKFEPERISEYKVKDLKMILRENNLTVSGTKEALIERLKKHYASDPKPKPTPGNAAVREMRETIEKMQAEIEEKNRMIERLSYSNCPSGQISRNSSSSGIFSSISDQFSINSDHYDLTSSTETITTENSIPDPPSIVRNQRLSNLQQHSFSFMSQTNVLFDSKRSPSAPHLLQPDSERDSMFSQSQTELNCSKYSDRDSGVNSQENLNDVAMECGPGPMSPPLASIGDIDWLGLDFSHFGNS